MSGISTPDTGLSDDLIWLVDAPLYIDEKRIQRFYNAVFQPDAKEESIKIGLNERASETRQRRVRAVGGSVTRIAWSVDCTSVNRAGRR
jgi:hypothetical protein